MKIIPRRYSEVIEFLKFLPLFILVCKSCGHGSLEGYGVHGVEKESDMTQWLTTAIAML